MPRFRDLDKDARRVWLDLPETQIYLAELSEMATDYRESAVRGAANSQAESIIRSTGGAFVALDRAIKLAHGQ